MAFAEEVAWSGWRKTGDPAGLPACRLESGLPIHTVAAGVARDSTFDVSSDAGGAEPTAGADPGPALLRAAGRLTITDANLLLGRLCYLLRPFRAVSAPAEIQGPDPEAGLSQVISRRLARAGRPGDGRAADLKPWPKSPGDRLDD